MHKYQTVNQWTKVQTTYKAFHNTTSRYMVPAALAVICQGNGHGQGRWLWPLHSTGTLPVIGVVMVIEIHTGTAVFSNIEPLKTALLCSLMTVSVLWFPNGAAQASRLPWTLNSMPRRNNRVASLAAGIIVQIKLRSLAALHLVYEREEVEA